jgi:ribosome-binding factor A
VLPAPDASRLMVRVVVPRGVDVPVHDVLSRLGRAHGVLRSAVAQAITRKRAPELTFVPVVETSPGDRGEVTP